MITLILKLCILVWLMLALPKKAALKATSAWVSEMLSVAVSECEPTLASLDGLLKELRRTCNLLQFVRHVRQQFKNLLLAHPVEPSDEPAQIVDEHQEAVAKVCDA